MKNDLNVEELKYHLIYEPCTGKIRWKRPTNLKQKAGQVAGGYYHSTQTGEKHLQIGLNGQHLAGSRVAWAMHHGKDPVLTVLHHNGDTTDNRICNLYLGDQVAT